MASSKQVRKKWMDNFIRSAFVDKATKQFIPTIAHQCFHGKSDENYPDSYPQGFSKFYNSHYDLDRADAIETLLKYLHFIGITLSKQSLNSHLQKFPADFHTLMKKSFFLFRRMAMHSEKLDTLNPYHDNVNDFYYFLNIETGQAQLSMFEDPPLPEFYAGLSKIPDGYENDPIIKNLFDRIESSNDSFFITGKAGTGKSTFISFFTQRSKKKIMLAAFTGIAAMNIGGVTLHSFFKFPIRALLPGDEDIKIFGPDEQRRKIIEEIDVIVIDEVSMLRADLMQAIDYSLRNNGGNPAKSFGGKQIILVGDIFQLPPVTDSADEVEQFLFSELYNSPYFFDSDAYKELAPHFFEFKVAKRQKDDLEFVRLLDRVRTCDVDDEVLASLNANFDPHFQPNPRDFFITLTANNRIAEIENQKKLSELRTTKYVFSADVKADFDQSRYPTSINLELKQNAQVIFVKNDSTGMKRWVNGTIGKVEFIHDKVVEVRLANGIVYPVEKEKWEHRGYKYDRGNRRVTSEVKGTFEQYPLKLAWAITIHKSQGLTFDNVIVDLGSGAFINGQLYTALSRCRTLNGLTLKRKIQPKDIIQDQRLIDFYNEAVNQHLINPHT